MRYLNQLAAALLFCGLVAACSTGGDVVRVIDVADEEQIEGLDPAELERLAKIKAEEQGKANGLGLKEIISDTPAYNVVEYLLVRPEANSSAAREYTVGGYDVLDLSLIHI